MTSNNVAKGLKWIENNAQMAISLSSTVFTVVSSDSDEGSDDADESSSDMFSVEVPLLKNGSTLRSKAAKNVNNNSIIVSNTCAFDTVSSILMTAYRDSAEYRNNVDNCYDSKLLQFSKVLANVGITDKTYSMRAKFLIDKLHPELKDEIEETKSTFANCETTACNIFENMLTEYPTAYDHAKCNDPTCSRVNEKPKPVTFLTYTTGDGDLSVLQDFVVSRTNEEEYTKCGYVKDKNGSLCEGTKMRTTTISPIHLFIDVFNWQEGECSNLVSETVPPLKIELNKIPDTVECCGITYRLRGVGCFRRGYSRLRTSIGHYFACCKRGPNQWEVFDDLQRAVKTIDEDTKVPCEFLVYTI